MSSEINLLPKEISRGKDVEKTLKLLQKIAVSVTVVFILILVAGGAFYFLMANRLSNAENEQKTLISNIQSLQSTEASLILLRDRIQKIQGTLSARTNELAFSKQETILGLAPEGVTFKESDIQDSGSTVEVISPSSLSFQNLITRLVAQGNFVSLTLKELSFSPFTGYSILLGAN